MANRADSCEVLPNNLSERKITIAIAAIGQNLRVTKKVVEFPFKINQSINNKQLLERVTAGQLRTVQAGIY